MNKKLKPVIQIAGMKNWNWLQSEVLPNMVKALESMEITTHCEVCVGGLGLQPTRLLKHHENVVWIINDKDSEKENLYKVIRDNPFELEITCHDISTIIQSMIIDNTIYKDDRYLNVQEIILQQIQHGLQTKNVTQEVINASIMILQNCHSSRETTYTVEHKCKTFLKKAENICPISALFRSCKLVSVTGEDLLAVIKKYMRKKNIVLWIDPPYYLSDGGYPEKQPGWEYHNQIYELLIKVKCKFVLFLRIKASRTGKVDIDNEAIDDSLMNFYDNRYKGKNLYYKDMPVKQKYGFTTERVITNFAFDGCYDYK